MVSSVPSSEISRPSGPDSLPSSAERRLAKDLFMAYGACGNATEPPDLSYVRQQFADAQAAGLRPEVIYRALTWVPSRFPVPPYEAVAPT